LSFWQILVQQHHPNQAVVHDPLSIITWQIIFFNI
jgi:hypothetical protein